MSESRFSIVFAKLDELTRGDSANAISAQPEILVAEFDEIAELRRLAHELAAPDQKTFTAT